MKDKFVGEVVEVLDDGSAVLQLPDELCEQMKWYEGTRLDISEKDGTIILRKLETDFYNDVNTFVDACDQKPSVENIILYANLIEEEFTEFKESKTDVEQLDACMDMIWVILGYCKMKGWNVYGAWDEVARSNLEKIDLQTGKVIKREDGKVLKPEGWTPPKLDNFV
jgi:hypothetical protein